MEVSKSGVARRWWSWSRRLGSSSLTEGRKWRRVHRCQHLIPGFEQQQRERATNDIPELPAVTEACAGLLIEPVNELKDLMTEERQQV